MANSSENRGIKQSWSLVAFVKQYGQPRYVNDFTDADGATFTALSFSSNNFALDQIRDIKDRQGNPRKSDYVMVSFSSNMAADETSMEAIAANAQSLQVVELQQDTEHPYASFKLCHRGEFTERGTLMNIC